jgi:hypothetical protein
VIEHLQRADGATLVDLTQATGWLPHTTRAALTGLRKRGYAVIRERIGAGDSVYRISDARSDSGDRTVLQRDAMAAGPNRRRCKRRRGHAFCARELRAGGEATDGDNARRFAAARCFCFVDSRQRASISMGCAVNGAPIWAAKRRPIFHDCS